MLNNLLAKKPKAAKSDPVLVASFYKIVTDLARAPVFYTRFNVPDTNDGRFDLLCLMLSLWLFRVQRDDPATAQALFDLAFKDVERGLREAGVGDLGVPKHMKRMIAGFYGRSASYYEALEQSDVASLSAVLTRNLYNGAMDAPSGSMGEWVMIAWSYLNTIDETELNTNPATVLQLIPHEAANGR